MALIDSSQTIVASYRYDEFGKLLKKVATLDQPFRFSTKQYDEATGLSYYGYRFYSPVLGRWMTRDPLGEVGGINLYGFVGNNPVNRIDPYGLFGWDTVGKLIAKQIGKWFSKKIMPDKGLNLPDEGDDDNDGTMNFMDPDSEHCKVNCTKGGEGQCVPPEGPGPEGPSGEK